MLHMKAMSPPIIIVCVSVCCFISAAADSEAGREQAIGVIAEMEAISLHMGRPADSAAQRRLLGEASKRLLALGDDARQQIEVRLADPKNPEFRRVLTHTLGEMPGEEADKALLQLLCFDKSHGVGEMALFQLVIRTEENGPFSFVVQEECIKALVEVVRKADIGTAGEIMRILGMCAKNDVSTRFRPILERFLSEVKYDGEFPTVAGTYVSPRVYVLNQYLLAFRHMGETAWEPLQSAIKTARDAKDTEAEKWLCLGAGFAKDPSVASYLKDEVLGEPDRYVRCTAIRAYAASAGKDAIPVLKTLLDDKTPSEYEILPGNRAFYIIGLEAKGQIAEIEHPWSPPKRSGSGKPGK